MTEERKTIPGLIIEEAPDDVREQIITQTGASADAADAEAEDAAVAETDVAAGAETDADTPIQTAGYQDNVNKKPQPAERRGFKYFLFDVLSVVVSAVVIAAVLKTFIIDSRSVPTGSMIPTINEQDRVIILKLPYFLGATPGRQDVVVFAAPEEFNSKEDLLKRVIGLPGDRLEVKNGLVYVNGEALYEPYINEPPINSYGEVTVPEGCYFMLGDNRNHSRDSRMWEKPFVPLSSIKGKVLVCYWPVSRWGIVE
jgi:signal peptidase I